MATGTTTNFQQTRDGICNAALSKLGAIGPGEEAVGKMLTHAASTLNALVKSIDPEGNFLWRVVERTGTTTDGTNYIDPATDVIAVDEPLNIKRSGSDARSPLEALSRDDWMRISDRVVEGLPSHYYITKTLSQPVRIYLSPTPDATGDTLTYSAVLRSFDFDTGSDNPDFPPEWIPCLIWGLTAELAPDYGQVRDMGTYFGRFEREKAKLLDAGTEHGNVTLIPFGMGGYY